MIIIRLQLFGPSLRYIIIQNGYRQFQNLCFCEWPWYEWKATIIETVLHKRKNFCFWNRMNRFYEAVISAFLLLLMLHKQRMKRVWILFNDYKLSDFHETQHFNLVYLSRKTPLKKNSVIIMNAVLIPGKRWSNWKITLALALTVRMPHFTVNVITALQMFCWPDWILFTLFFFLLLIT